MIGRVRPLLIILIHRFLVLLRAASSLTLSRCSGDSHT